MDRSWLKRVRELDGALFRRVNGIDDPRAAKLFRAVTELGSIWASIGAAVALSAARRRREALDALGAAGFMWLMAQAAKRLVHRPRPYDALSDARVMINRPHGTSWPSSHPAVLLVFVTVACRNLGVPLPARALATALVGVVGLSRVHLGVHYPADVAGGLVLGRATADLWSAVLSPEPWPGPPSTATPGRVTA
jgi:membrane-associated phospholipid phosphatase